MLSWFYDMITVLFNNTVYYDRHGNRKGWFTEINKVLEKYYFKLHIEIHV